MLTNRIISQGRRLTKRDLIIILRHRQHAVLLAGCTCLNPGMLVCENFTIHCACPSEHLAAEVLVAGGLQVLHVVVPLACDRPFQLILVR